MSKVNAHFRTLNILFHIHSVIIPGNHIYKIKSSDREPMYHETCGQLTLAIVMLSYSESFIHSWPKYITLGRESFYLSFTTFQHNTHIVE